MSKQFSIFRDTRHIQILTLLLIVAGVGAAAIRSQLIPKSFGQQGPYRSEALKRNSDLPQVLPSDASCVRCHQAVHDERAESPHQAVRCFHCHGTGHTHVAQAEKALTTPDSPVAAAAEWDRLFPSRIDLFKAKDRAICLSCHESVVGMPAGFRSIVVAEHLETQGAENTDHADVCFECHNGHSPGL